MDAQKNCRICGKTNWELSKTGHKVRLLDGIVQIGQGMKKPLITFCSEKCYNKYKKMEEKN